MDNSIEFESTLAHAFYVAANAAEATRYALENGDGDSIVDAWLELVDKDLTDAVASMRQTLSRESKKAFGFGMTVNVKEAKLVKANTRKADPAKEARKAALSALNKALVGLSVAEIDMVTDYALTVSAPVQLKAVA
jgi:hypothetical protein